MIPDMKKTAIIFCVLALSAACRQAEDPRFFAPELSFEAASLSASAESGGADVRITLSRPAPLAFTVGLSYSSSLQEGVQFLADHSVDVAQGLTTAQAHITLINEEIWDENSWIEVSLAPGTRYTVNPATGNCTARVQVSKAVVLPLLSLSLEEGSPEMNPYRPQPLKFKITATVAPKADALVTLDLGDLVAGKDYLLDGAATNQLTLPQGQKSLSFGLEILKMDISGLDKQISVAPIPSKGVYGTASDGSVTLHLCDPAVSFKSLFLTPAQKGDGYQVRQAFKQADGGWNGNLAANWTVSAEGSNYLKSLKNLDPDTYGCPSVAVGLHILRLTELFPALRTTSGDAILDYGNNNNTRGFTPADSLFRFVLDPGSATEGDLVLGRPRTFTAFTGSYADWKEAWKADANATGGDITRSASPILTGRIDVTLVKLEGRFNLADKENTLLFTAWFQCDHPQFMEGVDLEKIAAVKEDGLWKVEYKLWPR